MYLNSEEYLKDGNLEQDIIGMFFIDDKCMSKTILQPYHFTNDANKKMFLILKDFYKRKGNLQIQELLKEYEGNLKVQQVISQYYSYASTYVIGASLFNDNEQKLIGKWQKTESLKLFNRYNNNEIDYKTLRIKLDEINQNQFFKNLLEISNDIEDTTKNNTKVREYTNIRQLDYLTKGIEYGTLNVWSSVTNGGKTTLMTQFARVFVRKGKKVFYFSGEQTSKEFKNYLYIGMCTKEQLDFVKDKNNENIIDIMPKPEVTDYLNKILQDKLYIYNNDIPKNDIDTMISVMEEAYKKGVKIFFIDNFMQLDNSEMLDQQTRIVEKFKRFARDRNSIVILVAHPRKLNFGTTRLNIFDISGTQNISNKATNICTIIRVDTMSESDKDSIRKYLYDCGYLLDNCDSIIEVLKTKGNKNGLVGLTYDSDLKTYKEVRRLTEEEKGRMDTESLQSGKRRR